MGTVISRFEQRGFKLVAMKQHNLTQAQAEQLYPEHKSESWFQSLASNLTSGPSVLLVLGGQGVIQSAVRLVGDKDPSQASSGSIRGDFGNSLYQNVVDSSDDAQSAQREIGLFFQQSDMCCSKSS